MKISRREVQKQNSELCIIIQNGNEKEKSYAQERLLQLNEGLIRDMAYHLSNYLILTPAFDAEDVRQELSLGMLRAAETFNGSIATFATYAVPYMVKYATRGCDNKATAIRIPVHQFELLRSLKKKYREEQREGEFIELVKKDSDLDEKKKSQILSTYYVINTKSLDAFITGNNDDNDSKTYIEKVGGQCNVQEEAETNYFYSKAIMYLECLSPREQHVIKNHMGIGCPQLTYCEISKHLLTSIEGVRQIEKRAIDKLRAYLQLNEMEM